ncbi:unnamed protein product [Caenorhabditis sp. 36 PRJEB53466]|nr:unnamed protein product [Caenorhabditis sp. 36 PRJEB53466]
MIRSVFRFLGSAVSRLFPCIGGRRQDSAWPEVELMNKEKKRFSLIRAQYINLMQELMSSSHPFEKALAFKYHREAHQIIYSASIRIDDYYELEPTDTSIDRRSRHSATMFGARVLDFFRRRNRSPDWLGRMIAKEREDYNKAEKKALKKLNELDKMVKRQPNRSRYNFEDEIRDIRDVVESIGKDKGTLRFHHLQGRTNELLHCVEEMETIEKNMKESSLSYTAWVRQSWTNFRKDRRCKRESRRRRREFLRQIDGPLPRPITIY